MEIGSFIELQFERGREYYKQTEHIARLNTGRAAIWHAFRVLNCSAIWIPYYQCDTVRDFLYKHNVQIKYYHIDASFTPLDLEPKSGEAVLLVNYYGVMSCSRMRYLSEQYKHVIIDNAQAFFAEPIKGCMNIYSCRKFVGVPDGAYVIGENVSKYIDEYAQCYSSDTALFLLQRIEYGCEGKAYSSRRKNEYRIDTEDCMKMSALTNTILDGVDYEFIKKKRRENFFIASELFDDINRINAMQYYDASCVPMIYPIVVEDDSLLCKLQEAKHFQGHWWSYLQNEMPKDSFEYWLSRYVIPVTIDQRYGKEELCYIKEKMR